MAAFFFMLLISLSEALSQRIDDATYHYPYRDPWVATSTAALMQGREKVPFVDIRDLRIQVLDGRDDVHLLKGKGMLRYRFYQQKGRAPLVFIIPGIASSAYAGTSRYLAELLAEYGCHVLVIPSPFNWNFTLSSSRLGLPGHVREDAKDLYTVMQLTLNAVQERWQARIGPIGLLGLSEGARDAGYIGQLDAALRKIGIETYLLINPPVDLLRAVKQIDSMAGQGQAYGAGRLKYLENYAFGVLAGALQNDIDDPQYFLEWDTRIRLSGWQYQYLIGREMQKSVGDAIYVSDLVLDLGILKTPISWGRRSQRFEEAHSFSMQDYIETFLVPRIRQTGDPQMSVEKLNDQGSLRAIETTLANRNVFLMHNLDDFLLSQDDIAFLEKTFGDRAKFYPYGGHLGNLWYPDNQRGVLGIFSSLLRD
ncbi:MAG: alpha/beta hydrolase [Gammaproteobacteria bacterium]